MEPFELELDRLDEPDVLELDRLLDPDELELERRRLAAASDNSTITTAMNDRNNTVAIRIVFAPFPSVLC